MNEELLSFKNLLEINGYEFTLQKRLVLRTLLENKTHLNAKEIYEKIKHNNIGIATVYRAVNTFTELGIVKEININGKSYYEMKIFSGNPLHIHFKCYKCNTIIDINSDKVNIEYLKLNKIIEDENNLEIHDINITFDGLCSKCKE
ncbi:MAG: Fur family transcriptional regulator [Eubacteriaceae bacterium]